VDAELSRRAAIVMQSPLYLSQASEAGSKTIIDLCVKANTFDQLPQEVQSYFEQCEQSIEQAKQKGLSYPYTEAQVMEALRDDN
jgi:hypothetical protein